MPIKLGSLEAIILDVPTIRQHVLSVATMRHQSIVLLRLRCSDGIEGIGEGTTIGGASYCDESPESIKLVIDTYIAPILGECDLGNVAHTMRAVRKAVVGNRIAQCAVETALLDAAGKRLGLPISKLLGGPVREALPVAWTLASGHAAKDAEEAQSMLQAKRHNIFKLKIGKKSLAADVAHAAEIKSAIGDRGSLRVDVNQAWSETDASRGISMLADVGVDLVEQPTHRDAHQTMARLSQRSSIAIMADESLNGPQSAFNLASLAAASVFSVKIAQSGGLMPAVAVGAIGHAAGIGLYGGTMLEAGVGTAASAHLAATLPNIDWGTELFGPLLLTDDILSEPLEYSDFQLRVPHAPGLGVTADEDKIAHFRRDRSSHVVKSKAGV